jgi:Asp-tRNA(Asn)/Glu-tRNA(Gln) amidotransferase A subunit family amidase
MKVLAGPDQRDRFAYPAVPADTWDVAKKPEKPRILWCATPTGSPVDDEVAGLCLDAVRALAKATGGTLTVQKEPLIPRKRAKALVDQLVVAFAAGSLGELRAYTDCKDRKAFDKAKELMSPSYVKFVEPAWETTLDQFGAAQASITEFCETDGAAMFAGHDVVATPTIAVPPFDKKLDLGPNAVGAAPIDEYLEWLFTWPYNLTGDPAVSVPCGLTGKGLPVGLQLAAPRGRDGLLLRAAAVVEGAVGWRDKRPTFRAGG